MHHRTNINLHTNRTSTHLNNKTHKEGVLETSEAEEDEDLTEKEVRLHAIIVDSWVTMPDISKNLQRCVPIVKDRTIMWSNVLS